MNHNSQRLAGIVSNLFDAAKRPINKLTMKGSYIYTTADTPDLKLGNRLTERPILAGFGVGIPLAKLYAKYLGGEIYLTPIDGYGTDVNIYIHKLGTVTETFE